jgi:hypothetical protein
MLTPCDDFLGKRNLKLFGDAVGVPNRKDPSVADSPWLRALPCGQEINNLISLNVEQFCQVVQEKVFGVHDNIYAEDSFSCDEKCAS